MKILELTRNLFKDDHSDEKVIDLSDRSKYPASVLADLNYTFALGDDSCNLVVFLKTQWNQPKFHWGWDVITHEEAVNSDFLFRAFRHMNTSYRKRRDALIAAEGCTFVWKNKNLDPVPGVLTGEQLCELMARSLDCDLSSAKSQNEYEEKKARSFMLNPTYEELMAEMDKNEDDRYYSFKDRGCGMLCFWNTAWGNKQIFMVNTVLKKAYHIVDPNGNLLAFTKEDIEWDNVNQLEHNGDAHRLQTCYSFCINDFKDGIASVDWMLYPDGRYFADEYGFGMEDNDEVNITAFIDTQCRVVVKFQNMESPEKRNKLRNEAYEKIPLQKSYQYNNKGM